MEYRSLLFNESPPPTLWQPDDDTLTFLSDTQLDLIIQNIIKGKEEYDLESFFYQKLSSADEMNYRVEIFNDIETCNLIEDFKLFSLHMRKTKQYLRSSESTRDHEQSSKLLLDAATSYCNGIENLLAALSKKKLFSRGLKYFLRWLNDYVASSYVKTLFEDVEDLNQDFSQIQYSLLVSDHSIFIYPHDSEKDYFTTLSATFLTSELDEHDFSFQLFATKHFTEVEKKILQRLSKYYPKPFQKLSRFAARYKKFLNQQLIKFDREINFYLALLDYFRTLRARGFIYCYPKMSETGEVHIQEGFDLSLALSPNQSESGMVKNDFDCFSGECIFIITGPNQGGKTTFARSISQILYLSSIGCPVPCKAAEVHLFDHFFAHFPQGESMNSKTGKLKEELIKLKPILNNSTSNSFVVFNELFSSTSSHDALEMGSKVIQELMKSKTLCMFVTHFYELASIHEKVISLVAEITPISKKRTYKIIRKKADGLAYSSTLIEKYRLTRNHLRERINK